MRGAEVAIDGKAASGVLAAAVREAGALALQKFRSQFKSWTKGQNSPVCEVDIAVDELLRERLAKPTPEYGWLSEESADDPSRLEAAAVWIVDPIDGTRAFISGREDWVISAALAQGGRPIAAAIYVPVEDALLLAVAGKGATLNGAPIRPRDGPEFEGARVAGPKRQIDILQARHRVEAVPKVHSLALRLARVATGTLDIAFAGGNSHDWDLAAADLIVHEAGGVLTTLDGCRLTYNRPDPVHTPLVAAGRVRHADLMRLLREQQTTSA
ncbi:MAG TPA: 3'(2'),5'-bisphosphate nucleotidase CysQ [Xanthobacteraceae bacterium]|nr:3'(2'),5'-bisphosphate nucleotidase CysQ [Xanthobacteraceae bacterium]